MPVAIDIAEVRRIASLAAIELDPLALETLRSQLQRILDYVSLLEELETGSEEMGTCSPRSPSLLRPDEPLSCLGTEEALRNAPESSGGWFRVPRVLNPPVADAGDE